MPPPLPRPHLLDPHLLLHPFLLEQDVVSSSLVTAITNHEQMRCINFESISVRLTSITLTQRRISIKLYFSERPPPAPHRAFFLLILPFK